MRRNHKGFTLIELMMTCVIVAILASIAIPSYRNYMVRAQRSDATAALLRVQTAQEKAYLDLGKFVASTAFSENGYYSVEVTPSESGDAYLATAKPRSGQRQEHDARCAEFSVNQSGVRKAKDAGGVDRTTECWR